MLKLYKLDIIVEPHVSSLPISGFYLFILFLYVLRKFCFLSQHELFTNRMLPWYIVKGSAVVDYRLIREIH